MEIMMVKEQTIAGTYNMASIDRRVCTVDRVNDSICSHRRVVIKIDISGVFYNPAR
jgi:hypothetical protein